MIIQPPRALNAEGHRAIGSPLMIVTLNGKTLPSAVAYNIDEGWVERYKTDEDGALLMQGEDFVSEIVRGVVMVFWG